MDDNGFTALAFGNFLWASVVAFSGVIVRHYSGFKNNKHKFFSAELFIGLIIAVLMGFIGNGIAEYSELGPRATIGLIAALGYAGPHFIDQLAETIFKRLNKGE